MFSNSKHTMIKYKHKIIGEEVENCQLTDTQLLNPVPQKKQ